MDVLVAVVGGANVFQLCLLSQQNKPFWSTGPRPHHLAPSLSRPSTGLLQPMGHRALTTVSQTTKVRDAGARGLVAGRERDAYTVIHAPVAW